MDSENIVDTTTPTVSMSTTDSVQPATNTNDQTATQPTKSWLPLVLLSLVILIALGTIIGYFVVNYVLNEDNRNTQSSNETESPTDQTSELVDEDSASLDERPNIPTSVPERLVVSSPAPNTVHKSGDKVMLTGQMQDFFEGNMLVRLRSAAGAEIFFTPVQAQAENYNRFAPFSLEVTIPTLPTGVTTGKWEFIEASAKDGQEDVLLSIPVKFE